MANFKITPRAPISRYSELNFSNLYLHQTNSGGSPGPIQPTVPTQPTGLIEPAGITGVESVTGMGEISADNWEIIYGGVSAGAKVVAHVEGLVTYGGKWCRSFSIAFDNESGFKGSTLEVAGLPVEEEGEWAIVGGTGEFRMANGVIYKKLHQRNSDANIIQLTINGICPEKLKGYKTQAWGTDSYGTPFDVKAAPARLVDSITVRYGDIVDAIEFSYIDKAGEKRKEKMGGNSGNSKTFTLAPSEYVIEVSGSIGNWQRKEAAIGTIKFVTNKATYGPFGAGTNGSGSYSARAQDGYSIVGFYGRSGRFVNKLGFYMEPL